MAHIETTATVSPDGELILKPVQVPDDIPPGEYRARVDLEKQPKKQFRKKIEFIVLDIPWSDDIPLRREDIYDDWGR